MTTAIHKRPWYREPLVWLLIAPPLTAIIAGAITVYLAIASNDGLVADDYYQQGKTINRVIKRDQAAARYGLTGEVSLKPERKLIEITLRAKDKLALPAQVRLRLLHATRGSFDQTLDLGQAANGLYRAALPDLIAGRWNVQLEADDWRLTGSLSSPGETSAALRPAL